MAKRSQIKRDSPGRMMRTAELVPFLGLSGRNGTWLSAGAGARLLLHVGDLKWRPALATWERVKKVYDAARVLLALKQLGNWPGEVALTGLLIEAREGLELEWTTTPPSAS